MSVERWSSLIRISLLLKYGFVWQNRRRHFSRLMFAKTLLHSLVDCQNISVELLVWLSENMDSLLKGGELITGFVQTGLTLNMDKLDTEYQWKLWAFLQNGTEWKLIAEMNDVLTFIFLPNNNQQKTLVCCRIDRVTIWSEAERTCCPAAGLASAWQWAGPIENEGVPCSRAILTENREFVAELLMFFLHWTFHVSSSF